MSLPPSALYPYTGVSYTELAQCYYSVAGANVATAPANAIIPLDAGTGTNASGLFIQFGRDVGLKPNRAAVVNNSPVVGSLVNTSSIPVQISGNVQINTNGAYVATTFSVIRQDAGVATTTILGQVGVGAVNQSVSIPFSTILLPNQSLYVQNGAGVQTATISANLVAVKASAVYGTLNSLQTGYIPA